MQGTPAAGELTTVSCHVCGSTRDTDLLFTRGYRIARCVACGYIFVNPRPTPAALRRIYSSKDSNPYIQESCESLENERLTLARVVSVIKSYIASGRLLEVGCARGDLLIYMRDAGFEVEGCDLQACEGSPPETNLRVGDIESIDYEPQSFDVVVTRNTLEHLFDPSIELNGIRRLLRSRGYLYLKVPNTDFEAGWRCMLMLQHKQVFSPPMHLNHFNRRTLLRLIHRHGFEIVGWHMEKPSIVANPFKNFVRQASYMVIENMRKLSGAKFFPQPLLVCIARKCE